ncbi:PAAR domain-containing protein [Cystobacter fuscus]
MHVCPKVEPGPVPHVGGPTSSGESTVIIGGMPAARIGDSLVCFGGPPDSISQGESTVIIGGKPAARLGDGTSHGGVLVMGCPTVIIGSSAQAQTVVVAARDGTPFCEECEKKKKAQEEAQQQQQQESSVSATGASSSGGTSPAQPVTGALAQSAAGMASPQSPNGGGPGHAATSGSGQQRQQVPKKASDECTHAQFQRTPPLGSETRSPEELAKSLEDEAGRLDRLAEEKRIAAMEEKDPEKRRALIRAAESTRSGAQDKRFEAKVARDTKAREVSVTVSCEACGKLLAEFDVVTAKGTYKEVKESGQAVDVGQLYKEMQLVQDPLVAPPGTIVHLALPGDGKQRARAIKRFVRSNGRKMTNKGAGYDRLIQEH